MTRVWFYSLGPDLGSFLSATADHLARELTGPEIAVAQWIPYSSERKHRGEPQFLTLLVCEWRKFSRSDYFAAVNALALQECGVVLLFPVMMTARFDAAVTGDVWMERYRLLWERLNR